MLARHNTKGGKGLIINNFVTKVETQVKVLTLNDNANFVGYHFPLYFCSFFNLCFCLLICPFYISKRIGPQGQLQMEMRSFLWQKIICGVNQLLGCGFYILHFRLNFFNTDIKKKPEKMYELFRTLCTIIYTFLLQYLLWFRQETIRTLINSTVTHSPSQRKLGAMRLFLFLGMLVNAAFLVAEVGENDFGLFLEVVANLALPSFLLRSQIVKFWEVSLPEQILSLVFFLIICYMVFVSYLAFLCIFISSIALYEVVGSTINRIRSIDAMDPDITEELHLYTEMKGQIGIINKVCGPILVLVFVDLVGFCATTLGKPEDDMWYTKLLLYVRYAVDIIGMVIAAEVHQKAKALEDRLVNSITIVKEEKEWKGMISSIMEGQGVRVYLQGAPGQDGLVGWNFFMISYPFLGTVSSICLTYALVMIQFAATPKSGGPNSGV